MADGRFALLLASSQYSDVTLTRLDAPAHDVASLAEVLESPTIGGFQVTTVIDQPSVIVAQEIEAFFDGRRRNDLLLLYVSGHGILDANARLYFANMDTRVDRPRSTAIAASFVNDLMSECLSRRQVLILDCCNSGAFARGHKAGKPSIGTRGRFEGRGRMVITASDALEYAFEADGNVEGRPVSSVFTEKLVEGLRSGEADRDRDGWISLDELYDYAYEAVLDTSPRQRPGKWAFGVEGQLLIARSPFGDRPSEARAAEPPPQSGSAAPVARQPARWGLQSPRRRVLAVLAAVAAVIGVVATVYALWPNNPSASASTNPERAAAIRVYDAWKQGRLDAVPGGEVTNSARQALTAMPVTPVLPEEPAATDCYQGSGGAQCYFHYPALGIFLNFAVFHYPRGPRVTSVRCFTEDPPRPKPGGIPACAQIVRGS